MLKKILEYEFSLEVVLFSVIGLCLLVLLFKVVVPNFGSKSLAASWMTMFGAFVIFGYSIFVELKDESFKSSFNTYVCFTEDMRVPNYIIPCYSIENHGLLRYQEDDSITYQKEGLKIDDAISVGEELILINAISYAASDFKDWCSEKYSSPGSYRISFRTKKDAGKDAVILESKVLCASKFKHFSFKPKADSTFAGYSILPRGSSLSLKGEKLVLSNRHFLFEVMPAMIGKVYQMESASPVDLWATDFEVRVSYKLFKSKSGHRHREKHKAFCQALAEGIKARLEVPKEQWPVSRSWL
ncbi:MULTISPECIES: hypothetical protein [Pseudomonas]|uniref:hypothetical protein n=1 Tax=Pseudomonas TaxID=286 RepID=UPI00240818C7|nr:MULTISPECIES: hypothetical protein [Pseudomonas]WPO49515.1 hypothetical protein SHB59_10775 [Pseudomonas sp. S1Bt23]